MYPQNCSSVGKFGGQFIDLLCYKHNKNNNFRKVTSGEPGPLFMETQLFNKDNVIKKNFEGIASPSNVFERKLKILASTKANLTYGSK